jgi:hypothetical protein
VCKQRSQEGYVGLDATDAEFDKCAEHLASCNLVCRTMAGTLDQHGIVVR